MLSLFVCLVVMAEGITESQAEQIARHFLCNYAPSAPSPMMRLVRQQPLPLNKATSEAAYYVFNVGNNEGFVIVSGSDLTPGIISYASKGSYRKDSVPSNVQAWLDGYAEQVAFIEQTGGKFEVPRLLEQRKAVSPLLKSRWGQGAPYNSLCPLSQENNVKCVTGCVATAMAQVMNYYKYPALTAAPIPAYTTETQKINMPEISVTTIDWENMLDSYGSSISVQRDAVAQLMLLCGQATEMDYNTSEDGGSGTVMSLDVKALRKYFGYDKTVRVVSRNAFSTTEWESLIYSEVSSGRPVLYGGQSKSGGHAFVVDGYDGTGMFHLNWGWDGDYDGYFLLSVLNPVNNTVIGSNSNEDGYSFSQKAVVGIQHGTEEVVPERFTVYELRNTGPSVYTRSTASEDFTGISIRTNVYNMTGDTHTFMLRLALLDSNEQWVTAISKPENYWEKDFYYGGPYTFTDLSFGNNLPDGTYYIVPVSATENSEVWEPCWRSNVFRIKATIKDNTMTLTNPYFYLSGTMPSVSSTRVGDPVSLSVSVYNKGTDFNDYICLYVDDEQAGALPFEIAEGGIVNFAYDYLPLSSGRYGLEFRYKDQDDDEYRLASTLLVVMKHLDCEVTVSNSTDGIVHDDKATASVRVTNKGNNLDCDTRMVLAKYDEMRGGYYGIRAQTQHLTLNGGDEKTLTFEFDYLEDGQDYLLSFQYKKSGEWVDDYYYAIFETGIHYDGTPFAADGLYYRIEQQPVTPGVQAAAWVVASQDSIGYKGDIVIPSTVTYRGKEFVVEGIDSCAFKKSGITGVSLPTSLRIIGDSAFANCTGLTEIVIPEGVMTLKNDAFYYCNKLTFVSLPSTIVEIPDCCFMQNHSIGRIRNIISHNENPASISVEAFTGVFRRGAVPVVPKRITIIISYSSSVYDFAKFFVPLGSKPKYETTDGWSKFKNIVEMVPGDVNADGAVDVADIATVISYMASGDSEASGLRRVSPYSGDVNADGSVDVADIATVISIMAAGGTSVKPGEDDNPLPLYKPVTK